MDSLKRCTQTGRRYKTGPQNNFPKKSNKIQKGCTRIARFYNNVNTLPRIFQKTSLSQTLNPEFSTRVHLRNWIRRKLLTWWLFPVVLVLLEPGGGGRSGIPDIVVATDIGVDVVNGGGGILKTGSGFVDTTVTHFCSWVGIFSVIVDVFSTFVDVFSLIVDVFSVDEISGWPSWLDPSRMTVTWLLLRLENVWQIFYENKINKIGV